jgi:hypothetical protein
VAFADDVERALFVRGGAVLRPDSATPDELAAMTAAGALVLTHTVTETPGVTVAGHHATVATVDELTKFLEAHDILIGDTTR